MFGLLDSPKFSCSNSSLWAGIGRPLFNSHGGRFSGLPFAVARARLVFDIPSGVSVIITRSLSRLCLATLLIGLGIHAVAREGADGSRDLSAEIRRTTCGVPHIRASDERGLGYGIGYAYAQDNLCLLANEVVTVNGERAKYFGPEQATLEERNNLVSDVFFTWLNTPQAVSAFWNAQTA